MRYIFLRFSKAMLTKHIIFNETTCLFFYIIYIYIFKYLNLKRPFLLFHTELIKSQDRPWVRYDLKIVL